MSSSSTVTGPSLESLKASIAGDVLVPADDGYEDARRGFFLNLDQRPSVVVLAESPTDVVAAVRFARSLGMRIAPQSTGHGASSLEPLEGAMLLRTSRMRRVKVDPATGIARAQAGAQWQDVTVHAAEHGLATRGHLAKRWCDRLHARGGIGWLARRFGLAANNVTAVELVTPAGELVRVDAEHEPDLFWALRGGGGGVGVVTALEFALFPVRELYAGALFFAVERSSEVLRAWRQWTDTVSDEVTSIARIVRVPDAPEVPEPMRRRRFALVEAAYLGDALAGDDLPGSLRELGPELDTFATVPAPALQAPHMDPAEPVAGHGDGVLLSDFAAGAIDAVVSLVGPSADTPLLSVEVRHLGGAVGRAADRDGASRRSTPSTRCSRPASHRHPNRATRSTRTCEPSRTPAPRGAPPTTTTTSWRPRPRRTRCSRCTPVGACGRSSPTTTPTGRSSRRIRSGSDTSTRRRHNDRSNVAHTQTDTREPYVSSDLTCVVVDGNDTYSGSQGFDYVEGISAQSAGSRGLSMVRLEMPPGARARPHLHEHHETGIYVLSGRSEMRYGEGLREQLEVRAGQFLFIPAGMPHLPYNPSDGEACVVVLARTDSHEQESVVLLDERGRRLSTTDASTSFVLADASPTGSRE
jgi:uncharacterized RmlC-like cupin family protein